MRARAFVAAAGLVVAGCGGGETQPEASLYDRPLPIGFPRPYVPKDNALSDAKVDLGRALFFDKRLSGNETIACATCHLPEIAFADGKATPTGSTGDKVPRNAPGLANVAYYSTFTWANPTLTNLEDQAIVPLFNEHPVELGITGITEEVLARFRGDPGMRTAFEGAFGGTRDPVQIENVARAIASYERTLISGRSPYDRYTYDGDGSAMSEPAKRGMDLFFSERTECYHCHSGFLFTTAIRTEATVHAELDFHNTGLYNVGGTGAYPNGNVGLYEFTNDPADMGKMRVPTLRNVALTAPYMHDGSVETLADVIDHYAAGGRTIKDGPYAGSGRDNPFRSPFVKGFTISDQEKADLVAFLESLTDQEFIDAHSP